MTPKQELSSCNIKNSEYLKKVHESQIDIRIIVVRFTFKGQGDYTVVVDGKAHERMVGPIIDQLSEEYEGKAVVGKVDVDSNQEFAAKYGVRNIPTVLVFQNGEVVGRQVGVAPKNAYADALETLLAES